LRRPGTDLSVLLTTTLGALQLKEAALQRAV
jgi:hypothetical protein